MSHSETMNQYEQKLKHEIEYYKENMEQLVRIKEMEEELQKLKTEVSLKYMEQKDKKRDNLARETAKTLCVSTFPQTYGKYVSGQRNSLAGFTQMVTHKLNKYYLEYTFNDESVKCKVNGNDRQFEFVGTIENNGLHIQ